MTGASAPLMLELSCTLDTSRSRIYHALTDAAELAKWWGPSGFTTPEIELDPSVGGAYRLGMRPPDGALFHLAGEFLEVEPPRRLAYSFRWEEPDPDDRETVVEITLKPVGDSTRMSVRQGTFATEARLALHRDGWTEALRRLSELLEQAP